MPDQRMLIGALTLTALAAVALGFDPRFMLSKVRDAVISVRVWYYGRRIWVGEVRMWWAMRKINIRVWSIYTRDTILLAREYLAQARSSWPEYGSAEWDAYMDYRLMRGRFLSGEWTAGKPPQEPAAFTPPWRVIG